jgi:hypothetical protein
MATERNKEPTIADFKNDSVYRSAIDIVESVETTLNSERIQQELKVLHASRTSRSLYKLKLEPTSLAEAALKDMSIRGRMSEIRANIYKSKRNLDATYDAASAHLSTKYRSAIRERTSTSQERLMLTDRLLRRVVEIQASLDALLDVLDIYVKDIDQASFALRNATEMLKVLVERSSQIV